MRLIMRRVIGGYTSCKTRPLKSLTCKVYNNLKREIMTVESKPTTIKINTMVANNNGEPPPKRAADDAVQESYEGLTPRHSKKAKGDENENGEKGE